MTPSRAAIFRALPFGSLLPRGEFAKFTVMLVSGTVLAQAISFLVSPLLTRLYTPADFGTLALFTSVTSILISISSAKFDMAIVVPKRDEEGFALLVISCLIALGTSIATLFAVTLLSGPIAHRMGDSELRWWLFAAPAFIFLSGSYTATRSWFNRRKEFKAMASNGVWRAGLAAGFNMVMGWVHMGAAGLINGLIIGQLLSTWLFISRIWREDQKLLRSITLSSLIQQARTHKDFPKFLILSGFVEAAASQIPSFMLGSAYGIGVLGLFALATRVVNLPLSLVGSAIGDVFRQAASQQYCETGNCRLLFRKTLTRLLAFAIPPALLMLFFSPWAFEVVFGQIWREAGSYVQLLAPMFLIRFISNPLSTMFYIAQKQRWDLITQTILLVTLSFFLGLAVQFKFGPRLAVGLYAAVYSAKYIAELLMSYHFTIKRDGCSPLTAECT